MGDSSVEGEGDAFHQSWEGAARRCVRRVRGCAQCLCRQYKDCVGGHRGMRVCSCQRANTCLKSFYKLVILPGHHLPSSKPFLPTCCCAKMPFKPKEALNPQRPANFAFPQMLVPIGAALGWQGDSLQPHLASLPHVAGRKEGCSAGWSRQNLPLPPPCSPRGTCQDFRAPGTPFSSPGPPGSCSERDGVTRRRCGWC